MADADTIDADTIDTTFARSQFPAFDQPEQAAQVFLENAGGSFACRQTIDALTDYYRALRVQPYGEYDVSRRAGERMDRSRERWAEALGVDLDEVVFGPSTSANTYVLAHAIGELLSPGDEVIVTNQDHEANTGAIRRATDRAGATLREWRVDVETGSLDIGQYETMVNERTRFVTIPHASNIVGAENDIPSISATAHAVGARVIADGVSFAPHSVPDVNALDADVYLFSLYKTYSVHQGLMVVRRNLLDELPNQGHFFNAARPEKRLAPAGPDHAQVAAAAAVLDYVSLLHQHHGGDPGDGLRAAVESVSQRWRDHERQLAATVLDGLRDRDDIRLLGPEHVGPPEDAHRCPTIAFSPLHVEPADLARRLAASGVQCGHGHFYAPRLLDAMGVDPERGVVRLSAVHYTSCADVDRALDAIDAAL